MLQFLFIGICISSILEMVGVGSIPLFINLLLKPDQLISYFPQIDFVIFFSNSDYLQQILFGAAVLLVIFSIKNIFLFCIIYLQATITKNGSFCNSYRFLYNYIKT